MNTHYKGTEQEILALSAWIKLARSYKSVFKIIKPSMVKNNLTRTQFGVLELLLHLGPMSQKKISDKLLRSSGNIVKVIDNLERNSLVRRAPQKTDRRANQIVLTEMGYQVINSMFPNHVKNIVTAFSILSKEEQIDLSRLCKKLGLGIENNDN
jgi:MarR family 2-MHQ and catechol resistance regulon transcriptional repressor